MVNSSVQHVYSLSYVTFTKGVWLVWFTAVPQAYLDLPGRDIRMTDNVVEKCLQSKLPILQEVAIEVVPEPTFRRQSKSETWKQAT